METLINSKLLSAYELERKLWGGYSRYAIPALEQLKNDPTAPGNECEKATWQLTRWYYFEKKYLLAYENLILIEEKKFFVKNKYIFAKVLCLIRLKRFAEANQVVKNNLSRNFFMSIMMFVLNKLKKYKQTLWLMQILIIEIEKNINYYLLQSTIMRNVILENGGTLFEAGEWQLAWLNKAFVSTGLAPLRKKRASGQLRITNITSSALQHSQEQNEKVSIIMPAYNAEKTISSALESLQGQTWKNIEIIIVDDHSTDDTRKIVESYIEHDKRIKLFNKTVTEGTYSARNTGLKYVTGDLVTVHDSDDWSHPQKIEFQVETLLQNKGSAAVISYWIRVNKNLEIVGPWTVKRDLIDIDLSSLMIRKEVMDTLGEWDCVSVSGDSEYRYRILKYYGYDSIARTPPNYILTLSLVRHNSLSYSNKTSIKSLHFGLRWQYRDAYFNWHSKESFRLNPRIQKNRRPFSAPVGILRNQEKKLKYDLVIVSDYALVGGALVSTLNYIVAARKIGKKVAIFHWRRYDLRVQASLHPQLYDICFQYDVDILTPGDSVDTEIVLFGYPVILQYMLDATLEIKTKHLFIIINQYASRLMYGGDPQYDPRIVRDHLISLFGQEGCWIPNSSLVLRLMREDDRYPQPYTNPWNPMLDTETWCNNPLRWRGDQYTRPVVGRHSRDHYTKWPAVIQSIKDAYGVGLDWDIRILGGAEHAINLLGEQPRNWSIIEFDGMDVCDFLEDLDFYVHYPHEDYIEEFGRGITEAMAVGIPVILPLRFKEIYDCAALYAEPQQVAQLIISLWSSRDKYLEQAQAGRNFVFENCDIRSFDKRVTKLIQTQAQS